MPLDREQIHGLILRAEYDAVRGAIQELREQVTPQVEADADWLASELARYGDSYDEALRLAERAARSYRVLGDQEGELRALVALGNALRLLDRYDESAVRYEEALALAPEVGDPAGWVDALSGLGHALVLLGRCDQALTRFQESCKRAKQARDTRAEVYATRGAGDALRLLGRYKEAQGQYTRSLSLAEEAEDQRGKVYALAALGEALRLLGDGREALRRHKESLGLARELRDRRGEAYALRGMGTVLIGMGNQAEAVRCFSQAEDLLRDIKRQADANLCAFLAATAQGGARQDAPAQAAVQELFAWPAEEVSALLEKMDRSDKAREEFLSRSSGADNRLVFAREWNSWQPLVPGQERARGGGYLLRWAGRGIAIDPGPGFLANLSEGGYGLGDIDAVLVTHNHIDHVAELPSILTLLHEYNDVNRGSRRTLDLFLAPSVLEAYVHIAATSGDVGQCLRLFPGSAIELQEYSIKITPYRAQHEELGGSRNAISIALELRSQADFAAAAGSVLLTGDTGWPESGTLPVLGDFAELPRPLAMVAHLGSVYDSDAKHFHPSHLGYRGLAALMHQLKDSGEFPERFAVSEFGIECRSLVPRIVTTLAKQVDKEDAVCDGTLGRTILLPSGDVACDEPRWCPHVCCKPSTRQRIADDRTHLIYRCEEHWPG